MNYCKFILEDHLYGAKIISDELREEIICDECLDLLLDQKNIIMVAHEECDSDYTSPYYYNQQCYKCGVSGVSEKEYVYHPQEDMIIRRNINHIKCHIKDLQEEIIRLQAIVEEYKRVEHESFDFDEEEN